MNKKYRYFIPFEWEWDIALAVRVSIGNPMAYLDRADKEWRFAPAYQTFLEDGIKWGILREVTEYELALVL